MLDSIKNLIRAEYYKCGPYGEYVVYCAPSILEEIEEELRQLMSSYGPVVYTAPVEASHFTKMMLPGIGLISFELDLNLRGFKIEKIIDNETKKEYR